MRNVPYYDATTFVARNHEEVRIFCKQSKKHYHTLIKKVKVKQKGMRHTDYLNKMTDSNSILWSTRKNILKKYSSLQILQSH